MASIGLRHHGDQVDAVQSGVAEARQESGSAVVYVVADQIHPQAARSETRHQEPQGCAQGCRTRLVRDRSRTRLARQGERQPVTCGRERSEPVPEHLTDHRHTPLGRQRRHEPAAGLTGRPQHDLLTDPPGRQRRGGTRGIQRTDGVRADDDPHAGNLPK